MGYRVVVPGTPTNAQGRPDELNGSQPGAGVGSGKILQSYGLFPPILISLSPSVGLQGDTVTVKGVNFDSVNYFTFNGIPATSITVIDTNTVRSCRSSGICDRKS
jgi:hypothetical protein